jgi:hypothetical protein
MSIVSVFWLFLTGLDDSIIIGIIDVRVCKSLPRRKLSSSSSLLSLLEDDDGYRRRGIGIGEPTFRLSNGIKTPGYSSIT